MNVDKRGTGEVGWDCGPGGGVGRLGRGEEGRVPFLREKAAGSGPAGPAGDLPPSEAALTHVGNSRRHRHCPPHSQSLGGREGGVFVVCNRDERQGWGQPGRCWTITNEFVHIQQVCGKYF